MAVEVDYEAELRANRIGPPAMGETTPWDFVYRLPDNVVRGRVWPIVSKLLVDADETIRARAVEFQRIWTDGRALTTPRILEVAELHPELYGDQQVEGTTLRYQLGFALSNLAYRVGERVAKLIREMNQHEPIAGSVMARYYPDDAIAEVPRANADWIEDAAGALALYRRDAIVGFLTAIRGLDASIRQRALAAVEQYVKRDDAAAAAMAKGEGFPRRASRRRRRSTAGAPSGSDGVITFAHVRTGGSAPRSR